MKTYKEKIIHITKGWSLLTYEAPPEDMSPNPKELKPDPKPLPKPDPKSEPNP